MPSQSELVTFLKSQQSNANFLDHLKITYRPYICPFDQILETIPDGAKIFDIGCGSGQFLLLCAAFVKPAALKGIEISKQLCINAEELLKEYQSNCQIEIQQYDGDELPSDLNSYSWVTMIDVLHHIPEEKHPTFFALLSQNMKAGSKIILKDINASSPLVWMNKIHDLLLAGEIGNELSMKATKDLLERNGFKIVQQSKKRMLWYPHFTLIAEKI